METKTKQVELIEIMEYCSEDHDELIETINMVCANNPWMNSRIFIPTLEWNNVLTDHCSKHLLLILKANGKLVGWCRLFVDDRRMGDLGIGIIEAYRDNKLGTRMLQKAIRWAQSRDVSAIKLICHTDNSKAFHVFRKVGFQVNDVIEGNLFSMTKVGETQNV